MASERHDAKIRLEHFREPFRGRLVDLEPWEKNQLALMLSQEADALATMFDSPPNEEGGAYGVVDVIDEATDDTLYQIHLYGYGDGAMFEHASTKIVANICQHGFDPVEPLGKAFMSDLAAAWREGARRMRMWAGHIDFAASIADDEE